MNRLLEDDAMKVRLFTAQTFKFVFEQGKVLIPLEYLVKICEHLMKRLDDVNDNVRLATLNTLEAVLHCLPPGNASPQLEHHMKGVYSAMLLHMDDSNEQIRNAALRKFRFNLPRGLRLRKIVVIGDLFFKKIFACFQIS